MNDGFSFQYDVSASDYNLWKYEKPQQAKPNMIDIQKWFFHNLISPYIYSANEVNNC